MSERPQMVVAGNAAGREQAGGHLWALAQWALGLRAAGVRTTLAPAHTADALRPIATFDAPDGDAPAGVLNVMGFLTRDALPADGPRVFLDIDPGYPQMWRELELADMLDGHDRFVTLGANIGRADCTIPDCGVEWIATPPPVDLDAWTPAPALAPGRAFTSVATWRNPYGTVAFDGITYGSRVHEFRRFLELPGSSTPSSSWRSTSTRPRRATCGRWRRTAGASSTRGASPAPRGPTATTSAPRAPSSASPSRCTWRRAAAG